MKKILLLLLILSSLNVRSQSVQWSRLFGIHSTDGTGGLSTNSVTDASGNIIVPVIESNLLKLYKLNPSNGETLSSVNTNSISGDFTNIVKLDENNYALIFNNSPQTSTESYKIIYFDSQLNIAGVHDITFPFSSNLNRILSFFKVNNRLYITVNAFSSVDYYLLEINSQNQVIERYNFSESVSQDHIVILNDGSIVIDFTEGHYQTVKCVRPDTGELIWQQNYGNSDFINLNYVTTSDNQDNIYLSHIIGVRNNEGNPVYTVYLKKINHVTGETMIDTSFSPISNCIQRVEDIVVSTSTNSVYLSYLDCDSTQKVYLQRYNLLLQSVNEVIVDSPNESNSLMATFFKTKLKLKEDGSLVFINRKYRDINELENIYINNLSADLSVNGTTELNVSPKNGDEIHTDVLLQNGKLIITGFIPSLDPIMSLSEVQYFVSSIDLISVLNNPTNSRKPVFVLAPNPVQNEIQFFTDESIKEVIIYDLLGKKIIPNPITSKSFDVSGLASGSYSIKVVSENGKSFQSRFIKK